MSNYFKKKKKKIKIIKSIVYLVEYFIVFLCMKKIGRINGWIVLQRYYYY